MNQNLKTFIDALRSDKYKQGYETLRTGDCFCVMGVACDISGVGVWNEVLGLYFYDGLYATASDKVLDWLGLEYSWIVYKDSQTSITFLNDNERLSFKEIADILEKYYENK